MEFDLIIRGGKVVDGTGGPARVVDVGIVRDRIVTVDNLDGALARSVIDATNRVVAPGFIDVHVHSELERLGGNDRYTGVLQGVTTELMAPDGFGWSPLSPERFQEVRDYLLVFYGDKLPAFDPISPADYLAQFVGRIPCNLVPQVPHLPIRVQIMGWSPRPATDEEIAAMLPLVDQWLDAGAVALATGLEYQPTAWADRRELVALSRRVAARGGLYVAHQRGYWQQVDRGLRETLAVGREANIPVHVSHLAVEEKAAALLDEAMNSGVDVSFDMYPYAASCTHLMMMLPNWAQSGGHRSALARLANPEERRRMLAEVQELLRHRGKLFLAEVWEGAGGTGRFLDDLAAAAGKPEAEYLLDLPLAAGGRVLAVYHWPRDLDAGEILRRTVQHPLFMGGSDGLFHATCPHPRGFGTFARLVGDCVRYGWLTLEQAVHKVSGWPAQRFRLKDRGLLRPGMAADVVVFNPEQVADVATYPHGRQAPQGFDHVLVNGVPVVSGGKPTGALPGRVLAPLS